MKSVSEFFNMGGYAFYVWTSYGAVAALLFIQWLMPWRRWKQYIKSSQK